MRSDLSNGGSLEFPRSPERGMMLGNGRVISRWPPWRGWIVVVLFAIS